MVISLLVVHTVWNDPTAESDPITLFQGSILIAHAQRPAQNGGSPCKCLQGHLDLTYGIFSLSLRGFAGYNQVHAMSRPARRGAVVKSLPVTLCRVDLLEVSFISSSCFYPSFVHLTHKFSLTTQTNQRIRGESVSGSVVNGEEKEGVIQFQ